MKLKDVLFVGGNMLKFASVKIRCLEIATHLGCDFQLCPGSVEKIYRGYSAYIFVKPTLPVHEYGELRHLGLVVWDVIDTPPPQDDFDVYLVSTAEMKCLVGDLGHVAVIPHYHCNYKRKPNASSLRRPGWIGSYFWCPILPEIDFDAYHSDGMSREEVVAAHRKIGIGLNFRAQRRNAHGHSLMNSGIKLINCIGFGIPSVSAYEPGYQEIGDGCTLFSDLGSCAAAVGRVQTDHKLYHNLRANCLANADKFHIDTIAARYRALLKSL